MSTFNLKAARINSGMTVAQFADHIDVSRHTYARLEGGLRVSPANAKKVAEHFGVQITDLPAFADVLAEAA